MRLGDEETRIESEWPGFAPIEIVKGGVVGVEQNVDFFRNHDRGDLDGKLITSGYPSMSRCLAGSDMVEVSKQ